ncbi:MAG: HAMP domain-containing histidine kinase [Rhodoferax sp.]|nr:HAMP domain-containing histidine kinase [Rhodoferax sp.]
MSRIQSGQGRPWRSAGIRLVLDYGLLLTITMAATIALVYLRTVDVVYKGVAREVLAVEQKLQADFENGGLAALEQGIDDALHDSKNLDTELFLLSDSGGRRLAGNLDARMAKEEDFSDGMRRRVSRGGQGITAYVMVRRLADGHVLWVGNDLRDEQAIEALVTNGIAIAVAVAAVLLAGGLLLFNRELERRVGAIRITLAQVSAGAMSQRVGLVDGDDEFALLGRDINKMLDQIETLMNGVRHVSDTIAHNLRTPLTRILLRLRAVADAGDLDPTVQQRLSAAIADIEGLTQVFEKLLQISEAEAGALRRRFEPVAVDAIARDVLEVYDGVSGATLVLEPSEPARVLGDPDLLAGVLVNLVDNALKYAGPGARVAVGTRLQEGMLALTVTDNGPGIAPQQRAQLGTRFVRLDRATPGHGLGLASVRAIVALHGGQLAFEDAAPGLRVCIRLPALAS